MRILGIETSCDETAAAVVEDGRHVLSSVVATQEALHEPYRGVVPEIAARAHLAAMLPAVEKALDGAGVTLDDLDAVAVANTPGLVGALLIGVTTAKTLAMLTGKPLVGVNHLHAHIYAAALGPEGDAFPCVSMVVSGGHTSIYHSPDPMTHDLMGATQDDAAGEAFDKVAAILGLGYPGGPEIDREAKKGDPKAIRFPRTRLDRDAYDFSFSGLKTAVLYHCRGQNCAEGEEREIGSDERADIAASFQEAVVDVLVEKAINACEEQRAERLVIGGGVARNSRLRERLSEEGGQRGIQVILPEGRFCIDNGAMVAGLAHHALQAGRVSALDLDAVPRTKESRAPRKRKG